VIERVELAPGYSVSRVINGLWQLSEGHRSEAVDPRLAVRTLLELTDAGLTTFDCADIYLGAEELLGLMIEELKRAGRDPATVQIHTKYVPDRSSLSGLSRSDVVRAVESSLVRLGVERLDLVQFHWWDWEQPGYLDVAGWLSELKEEGKIRCLGTTNFDTVHLDELVRAGFPVATNQAQYSLIDRRVDENMAARCRRHGVRILCYGVLAGGFLSGRYLGAGEPEPPFGNRSLTKYKLIVDDFGGWNLLQELLASLDVIAARHATSVSAVATRWVLDRDPVAAVMIGSRSAAHLDDTLSVFATRLDDEDRDRIDGVIGRSAGPAGEPFELEREPGGRHSGIMWTDLNSRRGS
jgi:aryl-alcohol dehydrogenase-like predicted oxidoreductase